MIAGGINNLGQKVGTSSDYSGYNFPIASTWENGKIVRLGGTFESNAGGINDFGWIVGYLYYNGKYRAYYWKPVPYSYDGSELGLNQSFNSRAYAINNDGQIVGEYNNQAFLWHSGSLQILGDGAAFAVNSSGHAVGDSHNNNGAMFWGNGDSIVLGTLGGNQASALGINDMDQIVGSSAIPGGGFTHAFIGNVYGIQDLNDLLVDDNSGWELISAYDINNQGQIVGAGIYNGNTTAFLLTPTVPEPSSILALVGGLAGLGLVRRRRV